MLWPEVSGPGSQRCCSGVDGKLGPQHRGDCARATAAGTGETAMVFVWLTRRPAFRRCPQHRGDCAKARAAGETGETGIVFVWLMCRRVFRRCPSTWS